MDHRIGKSGALACVLALSLTACAAVAQEQAASPAPAVAGEPLPSLPDGGVGADLSRKLGIFRTLAEAVAAAKAAQLAPGTYGTATVGSRVVAIDPAGKAYHLTYMGGSGRGQRPPQ